MNQDYAAAEKKGSPGTAFAAQRKAALTAGVGILLMIIPAVFAEFFVLDSIIVPGDVAATAANALASEMLFRLAVFCFILVFILDVIVSWGLYGFFTLVDRNLSLLAAWFRLIYSAILACATIYLGNSLRLLFASTTSAGLENTQLQAQAFLNLHAFRDGWDFGLVLFGIHLFLLGYLMFKSGYMPKILAALLVIAGVGYVFDSVVALLFPSFVVTVSLFTFIGELVLAVWLVVKSASSRQWQKLAEAAS